MNLEVQPQLAGGVIALVILVAISATLYWMLHPPTSRAERAAQAAQRDVEEIIGSIVVVFSPEIRSEHMMALAARLARRARAHLLAAYFIEIPLTLPVGAEMEDEHRVAEDVLITAEAIARQSNVEISKEIVRTRQVSQGVLELARRSDAHLLVVGAYREGRYTGAPLGRAIEQIAANAPCDVLIGVPGPRGKLLVEPPPAPRPQASPDVSY